MRIHVFQHVAFEGLGYLAQHLSLGAHVIHTTEFFTQPDLPELGQVDALIILGGPMSVHDVEHYPWLVAEHDFIRRFAATGKPMLGICLGAQLIASALGGEVYANADKEIGWWPVLGTGAVNAFKFPQQLDIFHWHGETFHLPAGAVHLARSAACQNQAFQLGRRIIGLQFHLETTPHSAAALVQHCAAELVAGRYLQSAAEILGAPAERYTAIHRLLGEVMDYLLI